MLPKLVYPAPDYPVPEVPPPGIESLMLGSRFHAWGASPQKAGMPVLVWCHGNAENIGTLSRSGLFEMIRRPGYGFLALDYPGYGRSPGRPNQVDTVEAVMMALGEARGRWPGSPMVLVGQSLGSGVAFQAADREAPAALVVISPFTSLLEAGRVHYPGWAVGLISLFVRDRYDSKSVAPALTCPVLVIHGVRDAIVPIAQGREMASLVPQAQTLWLPTAGHNDLLSQQGVWQKLFEFIDESTRVTMNAP